MNNERSNNLKDIKFDRDDEGSSQKNSTEESELGSDDDNGSINASIKLFERKFNRFMYGDDIDKQIASVFQEFSFFMRAFNLTVSSS